METVVIAIMFMVCLSFVLRLTFYKPLGVLVASLIAAVFVAMMWSVAINSSRTQIQDWLGNQQLMLDTSVVLTIDVALQMSFCVLACRALSAYESLGKSMKVLWHVLRVVPGLLILPVLFAILVEVIFAFPGEDFQTVAMITGGVVLVVSSVLAFGLNWLLPEKELRLEMLFLLSALIGILGIVATVNGRTAVDGTGSVEWGALAGVICLMAAGAIVGVVVFAVGQRRRAKQMRTQN